MIIRSQDKRIITTDMNLEIYHDERDKVFEISNGAVGIIGVYSTEEKAIKVLDMIYEQYQTSIHNCKVFQMPQDNEVN